MTAFVDEACTFMFITSTFFAANNTSNTLVVVYNGTTTTLTLATNITNGYTLTPAALGMTTTFKDGVYSLTLTTISVASVKTTESLCRASLCGIKCDMIDNYVAADFDKAMAYEALKLANGCLKCDCTILNTLYTILTNTPVDDCNCGSTSV
jgi:hypothetical protein